MTQHEADRRDELSPVKRALLEIRELRSRLAAMENAASEPLAIIGIGCRLPGGVVDADSLWAVLRGGVDTIGPAPADRWDASHCFDEDPDRPGTMWTRNGGFLDNVDQFDAAFFGISPREAASMDPQQRLVLETGWEALEDAGMAPDGLAGSATGVFIGVGNSDYSRRLFRRREQIDAYSGSGGSASVIPGRLSYQLGLQGPSIAVDTACSASLVAVHLACQSLRRGDCELALAGGVNVILGPDAHIAFTKARMLSRDGRCKTFDAAADGYGRGEGVAMIVLRRLSDAVVRGDRILAVIRGSAVNQDGRSAGLTAPNGPAQVAVIQAALRDARLPPRDIDYVEAHGTGTSLGDPIELQAIAQALGSERAAGDPLLVGSCKTNFGHLEAAAGIVGLVKVALSLRHRELAPHLHFTTPNPLLDWNAAPLRVPTALQAWPGRDRPARAGVSSFGFSGTNAHVVLESPPDRHSIPSSLDTADRPRHVLALSAATEAALRELAQKYVAQLERGPVDIASFCWSANTGRAHLSRRLAVCAATQQELVAGLRAFIDGNDAANLRTSPVEGVTAPVVGMLFTGQGAQRVAMGRTLYATSPAFRAVFDEVATALDPMLERPLTALFGDDDETIRLLTQTAYAQPALFALEVSLANLWRRWGVEPAVVLGHSVGEIAAACVAGVMDVGTGARLVAARARAMQALPCRGTMATVFAPRASVEAAIIGEPVEIAAFNGPEQLVITGDIDRIDAVCSALEHRGVRTRRLQVANAFHSRAMEPALPGFAAEIAMLPLSAPRITLISNVTGAVAEPERIATAQYWCDHVRSPVQFEASVRNALAMGVTHLVEIGPAPVLLGMVAPLGELPGEALLPSLRPPTEEWCSLLGALQALYVAGVDVDWRAFDEDYARQRVRVPTYPFQRRRHWFELPVEAPGGQGSEGEPTARLVRALTTALDRQSDLQPIGVDLTGYDAKWRRLEGLTVALSTEVLRSAGLFASAGARADLASVRQRLGAPMTYDHLLSRWLDRLVDTGALHRERATDQRLEYVANEPLPGSDVAAALRDVADALRGNPALLDYVAHCARLLPDVIAGRVSALETLFPNGSFDLAEGLYQRSSTARYINDLAATALGILVAARSSKKPVRILEVGGGTGGTTASLLKGLPDDTQYVFTDVSEFFFDRARRKFAGHPQIRFRTFDLEQHAAPQGFPAHGFDVIVAANVVHATRNLPRTLSILRELLIPGGALVLVESTRHLAWFDMTTGLIEGWQAFEDDLRTDNPLLAPERWLEALQAAGFDTADAWPRAGQAAAEIGQHLIIGITPAAGAIPADRGAGADELASSTGMELLSTDSQPSPSAAGVWRARFADSVESEHDGLLRELIREQVMHVLHLAPHEVPAPNDRLMDLGFDSLMAVQLRGELTEALGLEEPLPATLLFDHPTVAAMAAYLRRRLAPSQVVPGGLPPSSLPDATVSHTDRASAVAAMSDAEIEALLTARMERG